jgi:hypothetical protein
MNATQSTSFQLGRNVISGNSMIIQAVADGAVIGRWDCVRDNNFWDATFTGEAAESDLLAAVGIETVAIDPSGVALGLEERCANFSTFVSDTTEAEYLAMGLSQQGAIAAVTRNSECRNVNRRRTNLRFEIGK